MGHLSTFLWINIHKKLNTLSGLEFSSFTLFNQKMAFENFWRDKKCKTSCGIQTHELQICS